MDILFINAQDALELRKEVNGQLILGTLLLQADFDVDVLRFCEVDGFKGYYDVFIQNMIQKILTYEPKVVSFYSLWPDYHIMLRIARELKAIQPEIYTVFGGPQPSATAQDTMEAMPYVDFICSGEGENTVVQFFTALLRNNCNDLDSIPGLYYRENGEVVHHELDHPLCDLNTLPHWDDRLYLKHYLDNHENYKSKSYYMPIDVGRGCPFSCTFCCTSKFWRRTYRMKSVDRIIEEIKYYKQKFRICSFRFSHDALTVNKKIITTLCERIIEENLDIKWQTASRIDCIDKSLIRIMKNAGLAVIELGVESGSPRMQILINKKLDLNTVSNMVRHLLDEKIIIELFFIYGFPEESEEDLSQTLSLQFELLDMGVTYCSMAQCRFNPGTPMTNTYLNNLTYDENNTLLVRGIFGLNKEINIIKNQKTLFPFYYNLHTPVRDTYTYLYYLLSIYRKHPKSMKFVRQLFNGNDLKLYKSFYNNNHLIFTGDPESLDKRIRKNTISIIKNTIKDATSTHIPQIIGLLEYEYNLYTVTKSKKDISIQAIYNFDYIEYKMSLPITMYSNRKSEILLQKDSGKDTIKLIRFID